MMSACDAPITLRCTHLKATQGAVHVQASIGQARPLLQRVFLGLGLLPRRGPKLLHRSLDLAHVLRRHLVFKPLTSWEDHPGRGLKESRQKKGAR
jgi:hypothetical protein